MKKSPLLAAGVFLSMLTTSLQAQETKAWIDVTNQYIQNPAFDDNTANGWQWESDAASQTVRASCMEFWNGTFNLWQNIEDAPRYAPAAQQAIRQ